MRKARFEAELVEGHKGVTAVLVPFDPEAVWRQRPFRLAGRRHGWVVTGTANGARFDGYVGERWNRFFITFDEALRKAARARVGDVVALVIAPTATRKAYLEACRQSESTTQPGRPRTDARTFPGVQAPGSATPVKRRTRRRTARHR
ncbi:MAG TPA: DUF1905 domain-containing protein [Myxococcaceae bacterium]|nr:DUF1905 domain-containing protein [Myxococcaceae bacterium]